MVEHLKQVLEKNQDCDSLVWRNRAYSYRSLHKLAARSRTQLSSQGVSAGDVVLLSSDFSPLGVATMLALFELQAIVVPVTTQDRSAISLLTARAEVSYCCYVTTDQNLVLEKTSDSAKNPLYHALHAAQHPGLVLFSSGSTGSPKGVVHDVHRLWTKYSEKGRCLRTIAFLLFDHIGGLDTLFYSLFNGSCLIIPESRTPDSVCQAVANFRAEVLPVSPSFLNLMLLAEAQIKYDLSSLKYITYGAEVMSGPLLERCSKAFPGVKLLQRYGTSEFGALRSVSKESCSTWLKIAGPNVQTRIVNGILQIKTETTMLGYLNAPSPFTADGWLDTGDLVEQDGEYIRFRGRQSDLINVGGAKIYPAEVEDVLLRMENVADVTVFGEPNRLTGQIVVARFNLIRPESTADLKRRMREHCRTVLSPYKIPARVEISELGQHNERSKKIRSTVSR